MRMEKKVFRKEFEDVDEIFSFACGTPLSNSLLK
jgi:hypothetical protein